MPECVVFDSGYSRLENLKRVRDFGWVWLTRQKANRVVNPDRHGLCPVTRVETDAHGTVVHLKGYRLIRLFKIVAPDGDIEWWASNDLQMSASMRIRWAGYAWTIEYYHRGIMKIWASRGHSVKPMRLAIQRTVAGMLDGRRDLERSLNDCRTGTARGAGRRQGKL